MNLIKRLLPLGISFMLLTGCASRNPRREYTSKEKAWVAGAVLGQTADIISTKHGLNNGLIEANPIYGKNPGVPRMVLTKAGLFGIFYLAGELCPEDRKMIYKIGTFAGIIPAGWNEYQIHKQKK